MAAASTVRFVPNPYAPALLARTPAMAAAMLGRAQAVIDNAAEISPYGPGVLGHYQDQFSAVPGVIDGMAGARANALKYTAGFIEFGTEDTPAFAPLRNGADMAGLKLSSRSGI